MYHQSTRPKLLFSGITGGVCAVGLLSLITRTLHTFTSFNLRQPFDSLSFILAVLGTVGGVALIGALRIQTLQQQNAALTAENAELRAEQKKHETILEEIHKADAQVEVTTVLCRKILKELAHERANEDTQPIARLHSINGNGAG